MRKIANNFINNEFSLTKEAAIESMVLLINKDNTLPLDINKTISLYGGGSVNTFKGGTGSGDVNVFHSVSIYEGLKFKGFKINNEFNLNNYLNKLNGEIKRRDKKLKELTKGINPFNYEEMYNAIAIAPENYILDTKLTKNDLVNLDSLDLAIYVISRQAGEGKDRQLIKGDYYLSDVEMENLQFLKDNFKKLIVILNTGSPLDTTFINSLDVDALILYGQAGEKGGLALAELLNGERNFSGKLTLSWPKDINDLEISKCYSYLDNDVNKEQYIDSVYVGYRYYDSFNVKPRFHFGFGLSYTSFELKSSLNVDKDKIIVKTLIRNVGTYNGKEVIEVYYRPIDLIDEPFQSLISFKKSKELKINEEEELIQEIDVRELATYDESKNSLVLKKGKYGIYVGNSSNNLTGLKIIEIEKDVILKTYTKIVHKDLGFEEIKGINHQHEDNLLEIIKVNLNYIKPYLNKDEVKFDNNLVKDFMDVDLCNFAFGTLPFRSNSSAGICGEYDPDLCKKYHIDNIYMADGPAGLRLSKEYYKYHNGDTKSATYIPIDLIKSRFIYKIADKIICLSFFKKKHKRFTTCFPSALMVAQSFDLDLAYKIGEHIQKEMKEYKVDIWLAPGMNIVRHPLGGRTFEYYSEDPLVSGLMASSLSNGVSNNNSHKTVCFKHFCCNSQEDNRMKSDSIVKEKALHDIYLKGFEIAINKGSSRAIMTSYNKLNGVYTNSNKDLLLGYLRHDLGFNGVIMTDWNSVDDKDQAQGYEAINNGTDIIMVGNKKIRNNLYANLLRNKLDKKALINSVSSLISLSKELKK